jgi:hypothetical protein
LIRLGILARRKHSHRLQRKTFYIIGPWLSLGSIDGDGSAEPVLVTCTEALALKDWLRITCVIGSNDQGKMLYNFLS